MNSIKYLEELKRKVDEIPETSLSLQEQNIMKFLKRELEKELELFIQTEKNFEEKKWEGLLSNLFQILQRTNAIYWFLLRPEVSSTLVGSKIAGIIDEIVNILSYSVSEIIMKIKLNIKEIGIDSITINISATPPSITLSITMK
ncbi:MAG: hypothetical protein QXV69_04380 [Sulfolobaceae archaeon]